MRLYFYDTSFILIKLLQISTELRRVATHAVFFCGVCMCVIMIHVDLYTTFALIFWV